MLKDKLGWDKSLKKLSVVLSISMLILIIICIFTQQELGVLIVLGILLIVSIVLILYLHIYGIYVYEDKIELKSIFAHKTLYFDKVIIEENMSTRIFNLQHKEILRLARFLDPKSSITKAYYKYRHKNKIEYINTNNDVTCNYYVRNFSIFGIILGFIFLIFTGIYLYQLNFNISEDLGTILFLLIFASIILIPSIIGLLIYINFKITVLEEEVIIRNFLGFKKKYSIKEMKCVFKDYTIELHLTKKKKRVLLFYFLDNTKELYKIK